MGAPGADPVPAAATWPEPEEAAAVDGRSRWLPPRIPLKTVDRLGRGSDMFSAPLALSEGEGKRERDRRESASRAGPASARYAEVAGLCVKCDGTRNNFFVFFFYGEWSAPREEPFLFSCEKRGIRSVPCPRQRWRLSRPSRIATAAEVSQRLFVRVRMRVNPFSPPTRIDTRFQKACFSG